MGSAETVIWTHVCSSSSHILKLDFHVATFSRKLKN